MQLQKLAIVVPTRNRSDLAINAIRSVLQQSVDDVIVVVSDNSTDPSERERVRAFCAANERTIHFAPPDRDLPMAENWNHGIERALDIDSVSHVLILTDRMLFKPGELGILVDAIREHPDLV